jgi:hypothetical protein
MAPFGTLTLPSYGTHRNTSIAVYQEVIFIAPCSGGEPSGKTKRQQY